MDYNNIKRWQKLISYLINYPLENKKSKWSEKLLLKLNNGSLELSTENAVYSYGRYYYAFGESYKRLNISQYPIENVLILGLGMGSILELLEEHFDKLNFVGVEADNKVIELFNKYICPKKGFNIEIKNDDAYEYVQKREQTFDLINIDLFIDDVIPHPFHDITFLDNVKKLLSKDGIVLFNRLDSKAAYKQYNKEYWKLKFQNVFPNSQSLKIRNNLMLVGYDK